MNIPIEDIQAALKTVAEGRAYTLEHFGNREGGQFVGHTPAHEFYAAIDTLVSAMQAMPGLGATETGTAMQTEWALLRPADSEQPLTPFTVPYLAIGEDEERARRIARKNYSADVIAECPLARRTAWWSDWQIVGDNTLAAAEARAQSAIHLRDRMQDVMEEMGKQIITMAKSPAQHTTDLMSLGERMQTFADTFGQPS